VIQCDLFTNNYHPSETSWWANMAQRAGQNAPDRPGLRVSSLRGEPLASAFSSLGGLELSVLRRGVGHQLVEQAAGRERDLPHGALEGLGVGL